MPLLEIRKINTHTRLGRWALTETLSELLQHTQVFGHLTVPETLTHEKRQGEWLASRLLAYRVLQQFTPTFYELRNDVNGKPFFVNSNYLVSITHTQTQVAVLISEKYVVGIDIETVKPKVLRVRDKFLAAPEKQAFKDDLLTLTIAWSAKEALYKLYGSKQVIFAEHLLLSPFTLANTGIITACIQINSFKRIYKVHFEIEDNTVLTYCLDENHS